jgi:hypothetical protein
MDLAARAAMLSVSVLLPPAALLLLMAGRGRKKAAPVDEPT